MGNEIVTTGPRADEVDVADVTRPDPLETEPVELVSGTVDVPKAVPMNDASGKPLSDLHCPLLVGEEDIVKTAVVETHVDQNGDTIGRTIHRTPLQVVENPVSCPDCGKIVERHMLVMNPLTGLARCAIATNFAARGEDIEKILGASPGNRVALADDAHPEPIVDTSLPVDPERKSGLAFEPAADVEPVVSPGEGSAEEIGA